MRFREQGITLVELMIAVALMGVGIMAAIGSYKGIQQSIQFSKGRTLATNIAQEKIQVLMQKSYYEVLVTTYPVYMVLASTTIAYDTGYFPPQTITEGGIQFTRYTYIQVAQENGNAIRTLSPSTPDTGMRQITETVVWSTESGYKYLSVQNVLNNPSTVMSNAILTGVVYDSNTLSVIPNALVNAAENVGWQDSTDGTGKFLINLSPGTFNFQASAPGYYSKVISLYVGANSTVAQTFYLNPISTGSIKGSVWLNNHVVISHVVASTGPADAYEFVELYNPSTAPVTMGSNAGYTTPSMWVLTGDATGNPQPRPELVYISTYIPANGFYLISNTGDGGGSSAAISCGAITVNGTSVNPDACWRYAGMPNHLLQCNALPGTGAGCPAAQNASGLVIGSNGGLVWSGVGNLSIIDGVGWTGSGVAPPFYETTAAAPLAPGVGMAAGEAFVRRVDTGTSWTTSYGNSYDSGNSNVDFKDYSGSPFAPRTTARIVPPLTGTPALGAIVSVIDGLSVPSSATLMGVPGNTSNPPYAQFLIPRIATGTWNVFLDSGSCSAEIDNVAVVGNAATSIPNVTTSPAWSNSQNATVLSVSGVTGMISGRVTDALGVALSGITVTAGTYSTTTNSVGAYYIRMSTGVYDVMANPSNMNATYAEQTQTNTTVVLADVTNNVNFSLSAGGRINGWISRDGLNPLPSVTIVALDSNGVARDTEVSGTNGQFLLINLTTGVYTVQTILDPKETSTPVTSTVTVTAGYTQWVGSFTVTGAMGTVTGAVTLSGRQISSGVLIVVSTSTLPVPLPALSSATLASSAYYSNSSLEDGTYAVDVRSSTSTLYTATGFYMYLNNQTPVISSRTVSGITVTGGATTSGINFAW